MAEHAWILAAVPAIAFIVMAATGRKLPRQGDWMAILCATSIFALFFAVLANFLNLGESAWPVLNSIEWTTIGDFHLRMGIAVDSITIVMLAVITTVGLMVNIFSVGYMKGEPRYWWYFAVLQLFVASMLMLVLADNLLLLYVAWELVGPELVPAHRALLGAALGGGGGEESLHHDARRRRRPPHRHHPVLGRDRHLQHP